MMTSDLARLPVWLRNRWGAAAAAAVVYIALFAAWLPTHWGGPKYENLIQELAFLPLGLFAAIAAWRRVAANLTLSRYLRRAWLFFGLSALALFLGDLTYFFIDSILHRSTEQYYFFDFFYLAFYPLAVTGLMLLPVAALSTESRWKFLFDLGLVTTTLTMLVWYFIIAPLIASYHNSDWVTQVLVTAYPVADLAVLAGIAALLLRRPEAATREALWLFSFGVLGFVGFDLLNTYTSLMSIDVGRWPNVIWLTAYLCFALAALRQPYLQRPAAAAPWSERMGQVVAAALPFVAVVIGYGMVMAVTLNDEDFHRGVPELVLGAAILTGVIIGRQMADMRENKRLTRELLALTADLEKRVQKRSRELQQAHAALLASQTLSSVGALASAVEQEINQPLLTIVAAGERLEQALKDGAPDSMLLRQNVMVINQAAASGARVMQALRVYSHGGTPELATQHLADIVQSALLLMGYPLKSWEPVRLSVDVSPELPPLLCDRNQMTQVLIQLLSNAREAMPNGGLLTLRARRAAEGIIIEVSDTGVGLSAEARQKIFDPFYTTKTAGSGLGLSVVSSLVRAHRGTVTVTSDGEGQGATFVVTLPMRLD